MKKRISAIVVLILTIILLTSCSANEQMIREELSKEASEEAEEKYEFNLYKIMRENKKISSDFIKGKIDIQELVCEIEILDEQIQQNNVENHKPKNKYQMINTTTNSMIEISEEYSEKVIYSDNVTEKSKDGKITYSVKNSKVKAHILVKVTEEKITFYKVLILNDN